MRTIIPHIIYMREPIKIKIKNIHSFLEINPACCYSCVSFDNCPGESRGDFFEKNFFFLNYFAYYICKDKTSPKRACLIHKKQEETIC